MTRSKICVGMGRDRRDARYETHVRPHDGAGRLPTPRAAFSRPPFDLSAIDTATLQPARGAVPVCILFVSTIHSNIPGLPAC